MAKDWRLAKSLIVLRDQVNALCPNRNKDWDGAIGDERHQKGHSDHNPNSNNVVTAIDITHDPANGFDSYAFADLLKKIHDPRCQYVISNSRIWNRDIAPDRWRVYNGTNPHDHHVHVSVDQHPALYDLDGLWDLQSWPPDALVASFHSLVPGGYFCSTPYDHTINTSIRCNNPGALNVADWIKALPGYVASDETTPGNKTAIFRSPEEGVMAYWHLLDRYAKAGAHTVGQIINRYGGGQDYSSYVDFVTARTGFTPEHEVNIVDDDANLLKFAKAMFRYEAGRDTPLTDEQILLGFRLARDA